MPEDVVSTDQIDGWLSALGDHGIEVVDGAGLAPPRAGRPAAQGPRHREGEGGGRGRRGRGVRVLADQRPRPHVPAQDGLGLAAHPRGRGRDRQAHRGRRAQDAPGRAQQLGRRRGAARDRRAAAPGKVRVKDVVKDIDEDEAEFNEQFYVDRVCKIIDKVRKLQRDTEKLEEKLDRARDTEGKKKKVKEATKANRAQMFEELSDLRLNKPTVDRIVAQLKNIIVKLDKAELEVRECERQGRHAGQRDPQDAARDARVAAARPRGRQEDDDDHRRLRGDGGADQDGDAQGRRDRGGGARRRPRAALDVPRPPRGRADGRPRQVRAGRGQPPPRGVDRQEVHQPRPAVPRPDPGGQHRPDEGGRQVRVQARLQVLDLRDVVDPPGDHPRDRRPGPHDPHPGPHDRDDQQAGPHHALPGPGARPRADARGDRRAHGAAARQGPQGPQDRQGADLARDARSARRKTRTSATSSRTSRSSRRARA